MLRTTIHAVSVFALLAGVLCAQRDLATLTGTVTDPSGAVIAGATVTITEVETSLSYSVMTDRAGVYARPALKPGAYTVQVEAPGFKKAVQRDVLLTTGSRVGV